MKLQTNHPLYQTDDTGRTERALKAIARAANEGPFDGKGDPLPRCKVSGKVLETAAEYKTGYAADFGPGSLKWKEAFPDYQHPDPRTIRGGQ